MSSSKANSINTVRYKNKYIYVQSIFMHKISAQDLKGKVKKSD